MGLPILIWAGVALAAACGGSTPSSRPDHQEPDNGEDGGTDGPGPMRADGGDGGRDKKIGDGDADAMSPRGRGINDRWAELEDCILTDLVLADEQLYALCEGNPHRLVACPLGREELESAECQDFVLFRERPHLNDKPLQTSPLVHTILNESYSVVTFTTLPDNHPGFYLVDRAERRVTAAEAWEAPGMRVGNDVITFPASLWWGAALWGERLFFAARNRDFSSANENYLGGMIVYFNWNGDGTVSLPEEAEGLGLAFLFGSGLEPTLFLPDGPALRVLNNRHREGESRIASGWDTITEDEERLPFLDFENFSPLGPLTFAPFKHAVISPDGGSLFLAGRPNLYLYQTDSDALSNPLEWREESVVSAAWGDGAEIFFAGTSQSAFRASVAKGRPALVSDGIPLIGEPAACAYDPANAIYYQGEIRDRDSGQSVITAMLDSAFDVE